VASCACSPLAVEPTADYVLRHASICIAAARRPADSSRFVARCRSVRAMRGSLCMSVVAPDAARLASLR
jgi:hypothetical protein